MDLLNKEISNEDQRELGPLKYLSSVTGWSMDKVVNWFLLLIIFVFDPLAIALVVAANFAFAQIRKPEDKEEDYFVARNKYIEEITVGGGMVEDNTTEPSESLKQRVKENQEKLKEIDEDYFSELEEYVKYIREEDIENLTYPQFVDNHHPKETTEEELEKLEEVLNIVYNDEDIPFDRITDTTKTFVDNSNYDELDDDGTTLRYKGR